MSKRTELIKRNHVINEDWCRELVPGGTYFTVSYQDERNIPNVETFIYVGLIPAEAFEDGEALHVFQSAESYVEIGDWSDLDAETQNATSQTAIQCYGDGAVGSIADIDGLVVLITGLRRRIKLGIGWDRYLPDEGYDNPDPPLTVEQSLRVSKLVQPELQEMDRVLIAQADVSWRVVARIVGKAIGELRDRIPDVPDVYYVQRIQNLVAVGKLESRGNLAFMRTAEVRLPPQTEET